MNGKAVNSCDSPAAANQLSTCVCVCARAKAARIEFVMIIESLPRDLNGDCVCARTKAASQTCDGHLTSAQCAHVEACAYRQHLPVYTHRTHPEPGTRQHCHDNVTMLYGQKLLLIPLWLLQVGTEALTFCRNFSVTEALTCFRVVVFAKKEKKLSCAKLCRTGYGRNVYKLTWKEETIDAYS